jgi:hypothetical protein
MAARGKLQRPRRYAVTVDVPRTRGWRAWTAAAAEFDKRLAAAVRPPVISGQMDSEIRRGRDYVRIRLTITLEAADVADAVGLAWKVFAAAAGDAAGWDMDAAEVAVRPARDQYARRDSSR